MFCYFCIKHRTKLSVEHNKHPAYVSTGFQNWKKVLRNTNRANFPKVADVAEMHVNELIKQRKLEHQYLKIIIDHCNTWDGRAFHSEEKEKVTIILVSYCFYMEKIILLLLKG